LLQYTASDDLNLSIYRCHSVFGNPQTIIFRLQYIHLLPTMWLP